MKAKTYRFASLITNKLIIICTSILIIIFLISYPVFANETKPEAVESKIAKGYSDKFCNAIGMGMSKDSALKLTVIENSKPSFNPSLWLELTFSGEENINQANTDSIVNQVTENVVRECGYPLGLKDQERIDEFAINLKSLILNSES